MNTILQIGWWRSRLSIFIKVIIGLVLIVFLLSRLDKNQSISALKSINFWWIIIAILVQTIAKILSAYRWKVLLQLQNIEVTIHKLLKFIMIGLFFNNFLPTSMGGDVVKGYFMAKHKGEYKSSYISVIGERYLGIILLTIIALIATIVAFVTNILTKDIMIIIILIFLPVMCVFCFVEIPWLHRFLNGSRIKIFKMIYEIKNFVSFIGTKEHKKYGALILSLFIQLFGVGFFYACAKSLHIDIPFYLSFALVPPALLLAMIPISLNGIGIREGAFVYFFTQVGVLESDAILFGFVSLCIYYVFALIGGICYITE